MDAFLNAPIFVRLGVVVRVLLRAAEHHVLEEVREPALARLHLVAAAGTDDRDVGDLPRRARLDQVGAESVLERDDLVGERKNALLLLRVSWIRKCAHGDNCRRRGMSCENHHGFNSNRSCRSPKGLDALTLMQP